MRNVQESKADSFLLATQVGGLQAGYLASAGQATFFAEHGRNVSRVKKMDYPVRPQLLLVDRTILLLIRQTAVQDFLEAVRSCIY